MINIMKNNFIDDVGAGSSRPNINQINKTQIGKIIENEIWEYCWLF